MISFMLRQYYPCLSSPRQWQHRRLNGPNSRPGVGGEKLFFTCQELRGTSDVFQSVVTTLAELQALRLYLDTITLNRTEVLLFMFHTEYSITMVHCVCLNTASQWCNVSQYSITMVHCVSIQHHNGALCLNTASQWCTVSQYSITIVHCASIQHYNGTLCLNTASQ